MSQLLLILSVMMFCLSTLGAASKCDDKIIKQIKKKFWNNNRCFPKELFRKPGIKVLNFYVYALGSIALAYGMEKTAREIGIEWESAKLEPLGSRTEGGMLADIEIATVFILAGFMNPEIIKATTSNYYPDEENIRCAFSEIEGTQIQLYINYFHSPPCKEPTIVINGIEKDGVLIEEEKDVYRYHLYAGRYGVTAVYKCSKKGKKGPPEGMIKVSAHGYEEQALAECIEDMASLGIYMCDKSYSDECVNLYADD